eukprot:scaffold80210_cov34-Tisochrysis_lutea.AAC.1
MVRREHCQRLAGRDSQKPPEVKMVTAIHKRTRTSHTNPCEQANTDSDSGHDPNHSDVSTPCLESAVGQAEARSGRHGSWRPSPRSRAASPLSASRSACTKKVCDEGVGGGCLVGAEGGDAERNAPRA